MGCIKLHQNTLTLSFRYQYELRKVFSDILGLNGISHFSLDLISPDKEMLFFSSTPEHAYEICTRGYAPYDGIISEEYYKNYEFYWWRSASHKAHQNEIQHVREKVLSLYNGFMLVRKWDDFYLLYSFATNKTANLDFQTSITNQLNRYLEMGDYAYSGLRQLYRNYSGIFTPPIIEKFFPFQGGAPQARYSSHYNPVQNGKVILLDFKSKKAIV